MNLLSYNINDIYNKNIILLGRQFSGKTSLIKNILNNVIFDTKYCVNLNTSDKIDSELNIPVYSEKNLDYIYNEITKNRGRKLLIFESFHYLYQNLLGNEKLLDLLKNNTDYQVTILFVLNNFQLNFKNLYENFYAYINILFLSSTYFNVNNYVNAIFSTDINEDYFENIINNYIDNKKYLVFHNKNVYYYV